MENPNLITDALNDNDELVFAEEELIIEEDVLETPENSYLDCWQILIVDDEPSVHQTTKLALRNLEFEGKNLSFLSAYTAQEAKGIVANHSNLAFILLDVVMEASNSGLELVKYIRTELNNKLVRIILRTGQPGEAPEESVITDYDINDYKLKVDLTRNKLTITAIAALRAYRDLLALENNSRQMMLLNTALEAVKENLELMIDLRTQELQQEVEERKKAENALRLTQFSLDRAIDAIYFVDTQANFFYVNETAVKMLGYSKAELLSMKIYDLDRVINESDWSNHWQKLKTERAFTFESSHVTKTRQQIPVEITVNYLNYQQQEFNCVIVRDIRERKQSEAQLQAANQKLQYLANVDGLTEIANRRSFDEYLALQWSKMAQGSESLALALCDVDYFKKYNDYYGHQAGDDCLKQIASAIANALRRQGDLAARYGGEEFAIILPHTDLEGAICVAQNIQNNVAQLKLVHHTSEVSEYITLSIGVGMIFPQIKLSPSSLIKQVDQALYQAKKAGRDRYFVAHVTEN